MQKQWSIDSTDGFKIHGLLDEANNGPSDKVVLIIHGMTGHPEEIQHAAAAAYFSKQGYDVIRPYLYCLYCQKENGRSFQDATIALHAQDINNITQHFASSYKSMFAAGHSYGGPSILSADTSPFKAISLWDPTFKQKSDLTASFVQDETGKYVIEWDREVPVGQAIMDENQLLNRDYCIKLAQNCQVPLQVIWAGNGNYCQTGESYHNFVKTMSDVKIVNGTSHCFNEPGTTEPLLHYTREWFEKFQP